MATQKKIPVKPLTSWSYSRYSDYCQCPLKFKLKHIDKVQEPKNAAMERGSLIHSLAEDYIKGKISRLPKDLSKFGKEFRSLRKVYQQRMAGLVVEDNWSFTKDWTQTTWNDWTHCWVRIKLDLAQHELNQDLETYTLRIRDWKTGKFREDQNEQYKEQLELYALAGLLMFPHVDIVLPELVYLDEGVIYPDEKTRQADMVFTRKDVPRLKKLWEKKVKPMMNDKNFAPRPNQFCKWCHYRKDNATNGGGQCKF